MERETLFSLQQATPRIYGMAPIQPIEWSVRRGEQWCIIGPNGSGKTLLADFIAGKHAIRSGTIQYGFQGERYPTDRIRKVCFESAYSLADYRSMYYQQRFHAMENEGTPTVRELILREGKDPEHTKQLCDKLNIHPLMEKRLIMLSSGELRRVLITLYLAKKPELIIFDNPFIGLDARTRKELDAFLVSLSKQQSMLFIVPTPDEIPQATTHILTAQRLRYTVLGERSKLTPQALEEIFLAHEQTSVEELPASPITTDKQYDYVLKMKDIHLDYAGKIVFDQLNWTVRKGEKWALLGPNGSGKSTLLSLLAADNPHAYSQDITLFDRKRGTGESIWDIKRHIGYISSEMHLYFQGDQTCGKIVASGLFDTIGLFRQCTEREYKLSQEWMELFGIGDLKERSYTSLSGGEQRLTLLARTMVKNPDLLILDEPLHGLDAQHKRHALDIIERFCEQPGKTLIYVTHLKEEMPPCIQHILELKVPPQA
ncbi:MAG: ATP-binding cassette domain-containing protein [Paludibacteraceae bacterium]|nr:ATP-binding cassette domain-containing protein [Paludibacteraceae bacterium]